MALKACQKFCNSVVLSILIYEEIHFKSPLSNCYIWIIKKKKKALKTNIFYKY